MMKGGSNGNIYDASYNMEKLTEYVKEDPLLEDVKEKIENAYPANEEISLSELKSLVRNKTLLASLVTGQKANIIVFPVLIAENEGKRLFQSNLGRNLKRRIILLTLVGNRLQNYYCTIWQYLLKTSIRVSLMK